jgi:hypothetical protein
VFEKQQRSQSQSMTSPPARQRPPTPSTPDDQSSVRERSSPPAPPAPPLSSGAPRERLEAKLRTARAVLGDLPAADERARLLHIAIMRRDEALLDGVLGSLGLQRKSVPPPGSK